MSALTPRPRGQSPGPRAECLPPSPAGSPLTALAFDVAPVALSVIGPDGQWTRVNRSLCDLLGYPAERLLGTSYRDLTHPDDLHLDDDATAALLASTSTGPAPAVEKRYRHAAGHLIWVRVTAALLRGPDGAPLGAVVVTEDIADRRTRDAELARLALYDPLTGVRNRAMLDDEIDRALRARDCAGGVVAVLYLDIDDFKGINDSHGHDVGDRVLVMLTARLQEAVREQDTVARLGGDEFVLIAHLPTEIDAEDMRTRIEGVCADPLSIGGRVLPVGTSVGMTVIRAGGHRPAEVLAAADAAMYTAKRSRPPHPAGVRRSADRRSDESAGAHRSTSLTETTNS